MVTKLLGPTSQAPTEEASLLKLITTTWTIFRIMMIIKYASASGQASKNSFINITNLIFFCFLR